MIIPAHELAAFLENRQADPHRWLGMHPMEQDGTQGVVARAFVRGADRCWVVDRDTPGEPKHELTRLADEGFFEGFIAGRPEVFHYQLRYGTEWGESHQIYNPYSFLPSLGEHSLYLFNEGNEHRIYEKLGAHPRRMGQVPGVSFAVWAPSASRVSLVGNFNGWDARYHPMRPLGASGVWELFMPGLGEGELYKFAVFDQGGRMHVKTDPYGTYFEAPPNNAAIVCRTDKHQWGDADWIARRAAQAGQLDRPMSIYEVHLGSWRRVAADSNRPLTYRELAPALADYVTELGFTHVEIMPVAEYPFTGSWGYQVTGYFAPTHRHGTPEDFQFFVDHLHQRGIGVILDWVPAHFPRDQFALARFDGTHLYEHEDPRLGAHMDWGTLIFNYGRNEVRCFLIASALAWFERFHIDGLRVDAVASMLYLDYSRKAGEWVPNRFGGRENLEAISFIRQVNDLVHHYHPGALMIAEESTAFPQVSHPVKSGGLGFDYKWNMGLMHDTLKYFSTDPIGRKWEHSKLTFGMVYQYSENFITVYSHDEVVHLKASLLGKMGSASMPEKIATLRAFYAFVWTYPGKKLLFMGSEFGQRGEWNHDASLDWHLRDKPEHEGIRTLVRDLNRLYTGEPAFSHGDFHPPAFAWVNCTDGDHSVISFLRRVPGGDALYLVIGNFTPVLRENYRTGVPQAGRWEEVLNTNSAHYGGEGTGNQGHRDAENTPCDGYDQSLSLTLPGLSTLVFKWLPGSAPKPKPLTHISAIAKDSVIINQKKSSRKPPPAKSRRG